MLKWQFHQYSGYKKPFVWRVTGVTPTGCPDYEFVHGVITRRSQTGKFGDFEFVVREPGLYKVGNTKDQNGYRFVFLHHNIWRYRSVYDEADAIMIARKLQAAETVEDVTDELIDKLNWHFAYEAH
jgi:hypothetical protein